MHKLFVLLRSACTFLIVFFYQAVPHTPIKHVFVFVYALAFLAIYVLAPFVEHDII